MKVAQKSRVLGLIPAKGASTRLPYKNILPLGGKPLIQWAHDSAVQSGCCDRVIVSTEDDKVAATARDLGLDVPFVRPPKLAVDPAGVVDVALHALDMLEGEGDIYTELVILLPTSPFRTADDIKNAYALFCEDKNSFVMSVTEYAHTPFAALELDNSGALSAYFPEHIGKKSQEMPVAYRCNGAIHVLNVEAFRREKSYYAKPLKGYVMPEERSVDIDNAFDFKLAEILLAQSIEP